MAIQTAAMKNILANAYKGAATHAALYTTAPGSSQGTEPTGIYSRKVLTWGSASAGVVSASTVIFDVPAGTTIQGAGVHSALTAGTYYDGAPVASQTFSSQGTYALTINYTQS